VILTCFNGRTTGLSTGMYHIPLIIYQTVDHQLWCHSFDIPIRTMIQWSVGNLWYSRHVS